MCFYIFSAAPNRMILSTAGWKLQKKKKKEGWYSCNRANTCSQCNRHIWKCTHRKLQNTLGNWQTSKLRYSPINNGPRCGGLQLSIVPQGRLNIKYTLKNTMHISHSCLNLLIRISVGLGDATRTQSNRHENPGSHNKTSHSDEQDSLVRSSY